MQKTVQAAVEAVQSGEVGPQQAEDVLTPYVLRL